MTRLTEGQFQLLDCEKNGQVLIIDALPHIEPKTDLERENNEKRASELTKEILSQQRCLHHIIQWAQAKSEERKLDTKDYLLVRKLGELLGPIIDE